MDLKIKESKFLPLHIHKFKKIEKTKNFSYLEYVDEYRGNTYVREFYKPNSIILRNLNNE